MLSFTEKMVLTIFKRWSIKVKKNFRRLPGFDPITLTFLWKFWLCARIMSYVNHPLYLSSQLLLFSNNYCTSTEIFSATLSRLEIFVPAIWIFTKGEGDGIKSSESSKIFFTLLDIVVYTSENNIKHPLLFISYNRSWLDLPSFICLTSIGVKYSKGFI